MKTSSQNHGRRRIASAAAITILALFSAFLAIGQEKRNEAGFDARVEDEGVGPELLVNHAECSFLAPDRERYLNTGLYAVRRNRFTSTQTTEDVTSKLGGFRTVRTVPGGSRTKSFQELDKLV